MTITVNYSPYNQNINIFNTNGPIPEVNQYPFTSATPQPCTPQFDPENILIKQETYTDEEIEPEQKLVNSQPDEFPRKDFQCEEQEVHTTQPEDLSPPPKPGMVSCLSPKHSEKTSYSDQIIDTPVPVDDLNNMVEELFKGEEFIQEEQVDNIITPTPNNEDAESSKVET